MMKYKITLSPVEPYFFSDENTFRPGEKNYNYFIHSMPVPSPSTIIGMLRYVLLEQQGILNSDGKYDQVKKKEMDALIGESGYCVGKTNAFGRIKDISPLVLTDDAGSIYIRCPKNHKKSRKDENGESKSNAVFTPFQMRTEEIETSEEKLCLPMHEEFDPKETVDTEYMQVETGNIVDKVFSYHERVGIGKLKGDNAYFKKEYCMLNASYRFMVIVETDGVEIKDTTCYMGREKSAFHLHAELLSDDYDLTKSIQKACEKLPYSFYYALSDLILKDKPKYKGFAMVSVQPIRMLTTEVANGRMKLSLKNELHNIIKAGSIFMEKPEEIHAEGFGWNTIIILGGNKK